MANTSCVQDSNTIIYSTLVATILSLIDISVICGNLLVICAVVSVSFLKTTTNYLITSLAVSDFLLGVSVLPFAVAEAVLRDKWPFGKIWCQMWLQMDIWLSTASIYNLVAISCDRYMAVSRPLRYKMVYSVKFGPIFIVASWVVSFLVSLPPLVYRQIADRPNKTLHHDNENLCAPCNPMNMAAWYIVYSCCMSFWIPLLTIVALNCGIYWKVRKASNFTEQPIKQSNSSAPIIYLRKTPGGAQRSISVTEQPTPLLVQETNRQLTPILSPETIMRTRSDLSQKDANHNSKNGGGMRRYCSYTGTSVEKTMVINDDGDEAAPVAMMHTGSESKLDAISLGVHFAPVSRRPSAASAVHNREPKTAKIETRVAKTVGIVVGCFLICWVPFSVIYTSTVFSEHLVSDFTFRVFIWLGYCNSTLNPLIYALFSRDFRLAFKRVLKKMCSRGDINRFEPSSRQDRSKVSITVPVIEYNRSF